MDRFRYRAATADGVTSRGVIDATSIRAASTSLAAQGLTPMLVKPYRSLRELELTPKRVSTPELMHVSRQMAAFLRAGIPILDALGSLAEGTENSRLRATLLEMADALRAGETFSDAIDEHPKVFPTVYRSVVRTAEYTGNLDQVLDQLSGYLERDLDTRRQIRSAATYPIMVFVMAIVTVVIITAFVMPRFESFFASLDATLPLPTRMLLGTTGFLGRWWFLFAGGFVLLGLGVFLAFRNDRGRAGFDRLALSLPVLGEAVRYAIVERFCRTLGAMVSAGVALSDAMVVAAGTTNNVMFTRALRTVHDDMVRGEGIAGPVQATGLFPSAATQMIKAGENTGTLDDQLDTAAAYFEQELRFRIKTLTGVFEPLIIVVVGVIVGFVALALVSAMYGIFNQVGSV